MYGHAILLRHLGTKEVGDLTPPSLPPPSLPSPLTLSFTIDTCTLTLTHIYYNIHAHYTQ